MPAAMIANSTVPNGWSRTVVSAASKQPADDAQRYALDAVANGAQSLDRWPYPAVKILGELLFHAFHDLGDADGDHRGAYGGHEDLPERHTHQLRAESLLTLP